MYIHCNWKMCFSCRFWQKVPHDQIPIDPIIALQLIVHSSSCRLTALENDSENQVGLSFCQLVAILLCDLDWRTKSIHEYRTHERCVHKQLLGVKCCVTFEENASLCAQTELVGFAKRSFYRWGRSRCTRWGRSRCTGGALVLCALNWR
jgi:hypothetical protein